MRKIAELVHESLARNWLLPLTPSCTKVWWMLFQTTLVLENQEDQSYYTGLLQCGFSTSVTKASIPSKWFMMFNAMVTSSRQINFWGKQLVILAREGSRLGFRHGWKSSNSAWGLVYGADIIHHSNVRFFNYYNFIKTDESCYKRTWPLPFLSLVTQILTHFWGLPMDTYLCQQWPRYDD